ncbi:MAG: DEAD/DEAH box helicase [Clostridia bacterium]|nr:DEAD/DEAH box helicase [Clostridia bacterium]
MPGDVLSIFSPETKAWFAGSLGTPTAVQQEAWPVIAKGEHVLVSAPTGTGKTLSAFLVCVDRLKAAKRRGDLPDELRVVYVSPLKALASDIRENLRRPLEGIDGPEINIAIRTGDTTQAQRQQMLRRPPHMLITTPESLYLLLSSMGGRRMLATADTVILDELHALLGGKRGAHLMFSLARLDKLCGRKLQRIGLSATVEPLDTAAAYLAHPEVATIVAPPMDKQIHIQVNSPLPDMRSLPEGTIWPELGRQVYERCKSARTVIAFVEGRAAAERLAFAINQLAGGANFARTHHGCVSKEQRAEAEQQLRSGQLRVLCATSSMELGIDVGEIDLVMQIGFPRTIASAMQRLGRAGHNPGRVSEMRMLPRTASEGLYCGLTARMALEGGIERARPPRMCLDVLAQHLVSMSAMEGYTEADALELARQTYCMRDVELEDVRGVLRMLAGDYEHATDRLARPRLLYDRIHGRIAGDAYSRMLALSAGGTIPDRGLFVARTADGVRLGELDEEFVFEARVGDKFLLGAFAWRITSITRDTVYVAASDFNGAQSPFWKGEGMGRDYQTGLAFGKLLRELSQDASDARLYAGLLALRLDDAAARNAAHFLSRQLEATGCLPDDRTIVAEHYMGPGGEHQMMVHSVFGRQVNLGLAMLIEQAARRFAGGDFRCFDEDDGFLLYPYGNDVPVPEGLLLGIRPERAREWISALLPDTPLFAMAFRYNAGRALMMGAKNGKRQPLWVQRLRGAQALDQAVADRQHPLMRETLRECLEDYLDMPAIELVLRGIASGEIRIREMRLNEPSPMSLPLRRAAEADFMYDYSPRTSAARRAVDQAVDQLNELNGITPAPEVLENVGVRAREPQNAEQLHGLLMAEGDLMAGETQRPVAWMEELARQHRARYIEPGLWICAEQGELYEQALTEPEEGASWLTESRLRIVRRCLRYRGPQDAESLHLRYLWPEAVCEELLAALVEAGSAVRDGDLFYHAELYDRARRQTVALRRRAVRTVPPARYAALLAKTLRPGASPVEQLRQGLFGLLDQPLPPALWESVLLPARGGDLRPGLLDELLQQGGLFWQIHTQNEKPALAFHRQEDVDWNQEAYAFSAGLNPDERHLVDLLARRGASFAQSLTGLPSGASPVEVLIGLAERGLVRADSFVPVRQWLERDKLAGGAAKVRAQARARSAMSGRWELTRPLIELTPEQQVERAFDRSVVLCRETCNDQPWNQAIELLRIWEYTGRARRGYFVAGMSGAQFVRDTDYNAVLLALEENEDEEILWLNAADPAQVWGKALPHEPGCSFVCVPGTAVALRAGVPVAVMERQGLTLRAFVTEHLEQAVAAFARDYHGGCIFPQKRRITVKEYPAEAADALAGAGFARAMGDYELWKKKI